MGVFVQVIKTIWSQWSFETQKILAVNFKISFQWKPKCKRPTTPLIAVQYISGAVCLSRGGVDARWLLDFFFHLISTTTTTSSTTTTHARTNTHTHTHTHALTHTFSSKPSEVVVLSLCGAAPRRPAGADLLAASAGQWSLSMGLDGWVEPCGARTVLWAVAVGAAEERGSAPVAKKDEGNMEKGTEPDSGLTPVPLHTADRPTLFLQASF